MSYARSELPWTHDGLRSNANQTILNDPRRQSPSSIAPFREIIQLVPQGQLVCLSILIRRTASKERHFLRHQENVTIITSQKRNLFTTLMRSRLGRNCKRSRVTYHQQKPSTPCVIVYAGSPCLRLYGVRGSVLFCTTSNRVTSFAVASMLTFDQACQPKCLSLSFVCQVKGTSDTLCSNLRAPSIDSSLLVSMSQAGLSCNH